MTQYMLSVHSVEGEEAPTPEVMQQMFADVDAFNAELQASGAWVFAGGLHPADTATVVDGTGVEVITTDGPFAETKDLIAGWMVIDVDSQERAIELAGELSAAPGSGGEPIHEWLEVRPFLAAPPTFTH